MDYITCIATIEGTSPMSQSHQHTEPRLEGEGHDDYDKRTWRSKLNTEIINSKKTVVIPPFAVQMGLADAAKYSKRQIPGQGKATWTAKFMSGVSVMGPISLGIEPSEVTPIVISANADGIRGSGKRVPRYLPHIPPGWQATFEALILDPIITEDVFREMLEMMGLFIGIGQFRPQKGGSNGRFIIKDLQWQDNRRFEKRAA